MSYMWYCKFTKMLFDTGFNLECKYFSCVVGSAGSIASQLIAGQSVRLDPVLAFGFYG